MTEVLLFDKLGMKDKEAIRAFIEGNSRRFATEFYYNPLVEEKAVVEYMVREIMEKLQDGVAFCVRNGSTMKALGIISASRWDSRILGKRIGKLALYILLSEEKTRPFLQKVYSEAQEMGFDAIFGRIDVEQIVSLQAVILNRAILGDILLTLGKNLEGQQNTDIPETTLPEIKSGLTFVEGTIADERKLSRISKLAYRHSHYFNDPHIPSGRAETVYQEWIGNSLRGYADLAIVAKFKEDLVGYITLRFKRLDKKTFGTIDLIAVDENYRRQGVGKMLVIEGMKRIWNEADTLLVSTQVTNLPALRLYHSLGFKPVLSEATFHVWFEAQNRNTILNNTH